MYQYRLDDRKGDDGGGWQDLRDSGAETTSYTITFGITDLPVSGKTRYEGFPRAMSAYRRGQPFFARLKSDGEGTSIKRD